MTWGELKAMMAAIHANDETKLSMVLEDDTVEHAKHSSLAGESFYIVDKEILPHVNTDNVQRVNLVCALEDVDDSSDPHDEMMDAIDQDRMDRIHEQDVNRHYGIETPENNPQHDILRPEDDVEPTADFSGAKTEVTTGEETWYDKRTGAEVSVFVVRGAQFPDNKIITESRRLSAYRLERPVVVFYHDRTITLQYGERVAGGDWTPEKPEKAKK